MSAADVAVMRRHRLASGRPPGGVLVFHHRGRPLVANDRPTRTWRRVAAVAGIHPAPRFHDLRHTWCVLMLRAGVRPEVLAKLGGWSDVGMVHRRYGRHALPDETADAAELLAAWRSEQGR